MTLPFGKAYKAEVNESFRAVIRGKPCVAAHHPDHECVGRSQFCHVVHRGSGLHHLPSDVGNGFPGCAQLHIGEYHGKGREWVERRYEINVGTIAAWYGEDFLGFPFGEDPEPPTGAYPGDQGGGGA